MKNLGERDDLLFCNDEHSAVVVIAEFLAEEGDGVEDDFGGLVIEQTSFENTRINKFMDSIGAEEDAVARLKVELSDIGYGLFWLE